jgi:hypothetical protein
MLGGAAPWCQLFWRAKGIPVKAIQKESLPIYGGHYLFHKLVHSWVEKLSQECTKIAEEVRRSHPAQITTEVSVCWVEKMVIGESNVDSVVTAIG